MHTNEDGSYTPAILKAIHRLRLIIPDKLINRRYGGKIFSDSFGLL
jgi:hypothetical protein